MSSVVAIWGQPAPPVSSAYRMLAAAPHRGSGHDLLSHGNVVLGAGNLPGESWAVLGAHGGWACALHGPIDNFPELHALVPLAATPAAAVAGLFAERGADAVDLLRGTFAGVATDGQTIYCFRDHLGGRPLFYRQRPQGTWVATEAKQVAAGAGLSRQPDLDAVQLMFYRGVGPDSAIKGVQRVFYADVVTLSPGREPHSRRYWDPGHLLESRRIAADEAPELLAHHLEQAVRRTVSGADAVALSGGIDSPTVAAFAAPEHLSKSGHPLQAYSATYPRHRSVDEWRYTKLVADFLGIKVVPFTPETPLLDKVEHWVDLADGPWDSLPMSTAYAGYSLAASLGARQVLTGTLAEYVFTINRFILGHLLLRGRWQALGALLKVRRNADYSIPRLGKHLLREIMPAPVAKAYAIARRHRNTFFPAWVDSTVSGAPKYVTALTNPARERWTKPTLGAVRGTTSTQEAIDICAATAGVVVRYPLADRDLWEFFLSLPVEAKFPDLTPKSILRQAMRGRLPDEILDRRDKTVFDEHVLDTVPWDRMSQLLSDSDYRMPGIDYRLLLERLGQRQMHPTEVVWANDLATVHAFINLFK